MDKSDIYTIVIFQNLVFEQEIRIKSYWESIYIAEDDDPSFDDCVRTVTDYVGENLSKRKALYAALKKSFENNELSSDIPEKIYAIAAREPLDFKINSVEIEIRTSLLLAISAFLETKLAMYEGDLINSIHWYGKINFWAGVNEGASLAQLRDWAKLEKAVEMRLRNSPKQMAKKLVRECWERWQKSRHEYKNKSSFARAMLDKFEHLGSQRVIERWCKEWESEPSK